jgi:hypothetical protein
MNEHIRFNTTPNVDLIWDKNTNYDDHWINISSCFSYNQLAFCQF